MTQTKTTRSKSSTKCRVSDYAKKVIAGKIPAGPHVRATCQRHLDDLKAAKSRGLVWDQAEAERAFRFFERILKLTGGKHEGKPFKLQPSQAFIVGSLLGWKRTSGKRRFRRAFIEMGKGNGKTPLAGGIGLYCLIADNENRAEVYVAASKKDQAMVLYRDIRAMVNLSQHLSKRCTISGGDHQPVISYPARYSALKPISSDKGQSGPRPSCALVDELHEHPSRDTVDMLENGFKFREQPILLMITNSGSNKTSVCYQEHSHAVKVAHQQVQDDDTFSYVCAMDEGDDPLKDPDCWIKANPLLGQTISKEWLAGQVKKAIDIPGKRNNTLRLNFCIWTEAESVWISREAWEAVQEKFDPAHLRGRPCIAGLDLSAKRDLTALARVWEEEDGTYTAVMSFWSPGETMDARAETDKVPYRQWFDEGYMNVTPSSFVDYSHMVPTLGQMHAESEFSDIGYDRWRIDILKSALNDEGLDLTLSEVGQGFKDMGPALEALEDAILNKKIRILFNPVMQWNVASAVIEEDPAGNRKFTKKKATGRIDGVVALAIAFSRIINRDDSEGDFAEFARNPVIV